MRKGLIDKIKLPVRKYLEYSRKLDPNDATILVSDPRGGSTWLSECLLQDKKLALIWEPLHIGENRLFKEIGFDYRQHIPENDRWNEAQYRFEKLLSGGNLSVWTTSKVSLRKLQKSERLLFKFCRAHLLLPWLVNNFNFHRSPIYLVRHPFAVVKSQLKEDDWKTVKVPYPIPQGRFNELFSRHQKFLEGLKTTEEVLMATWCICNGYLLTHPGNNIDWITITYENLLIRPEIEVHRISKRWGEKISVNVSAMNKPSSTSKTLYSGIQERLNTWEHYFSQDQINKFVDILDYFKIDLYSRDIIPSKSFD